MIIDSENIMIYALLIKKGEFQAVILFELYLFLFMHLLSQL